MSINFPEWLRGRELEHDFDSYEKLDALLRSHLKSQIAILHELWKPASHNMGTLVRLPAWGNRLTEYKALDWAVFVLDEAYASPAGFAAALLPAIVAGVENIFIVRAGPKDAALHPAIASVMELLGREEIFSLLLDDCARLAEELAAQSPYGKLISLGADFEHAACVVPAKAHIGLAEAKIDKNIMDWLQPGAQIEPYEAGSFYDAVITPSPAFFQDCQAPLVLGPGYEYFWQWPNLNPYFFQRQSVFISRADR